jgi:AcrR family transcriptional regulator
LSKSKHLFSLLSNKQTGESVAEPTPDRRRDASRSRESILDAAERLFAARGYEATSLQEVGAAAGVSRGTPSYFFRSKAELYGAVLERSFGQVRNAVKSGRERALRSGEPADVVLAGAVGEYFDFISGHPHFVRLLEWEALQGGGQLGELAPHLGAIHEAVAAIADELGFGTDDRGQAEQLVLSILSLCCFPLIHSRTLLPGMSHNTDDPAFAGNRRQHVIDLVLHGMRGRLAPATSTAHPTEAS